MPMPLPATAPATARRAAGLTLVSGLAAVALLAFLGLPDLIPFALFTGLTFCSGLYVAPASNRGGALSLTLAVNVAALLLADPATATWATAVGIALVGLLRQGRWWLFNSAQLALSVGLAGLVFLWLRPGGGSLNLVADGWPILAAVFVRIVVNYSIVSLSSWLMVGASWQELLLSPTALRSFGSFFLMASMGVLAALLFAVHPLAIAFLVAPLYSLHLALKESTLLAEANQQLGELNQGLEEKVQERTQEQEQMVARLERSLAESQTLQQAASLLVGELDLATVLENLTRAVASLVGGGSSFVALLDHERLLMRAVSGQVLEPYLGFELSPTGSLSGLAVSVGEVLLSHDAPNDPRVEQALALETGICSLAVAPLRAKGQIYGVLGVASLLPKSFTAADGRLLAALASQAAVAIQNATLYGHAQTVAVYEERNRLARELHDSVTQSLFSMVLNISALQTVIEQDPSRASELAQRSLAIGQEALAEMRGLIFELRPQALAEKGLALALENHLNLFERRSGARVTFTYDQSLRLSGEQESCLYRVAQEALSNVLKHAKATEVKVAIEGCRQVVRLKVADNGIGFEVTTAGDHNSFGLTSMRERLAGLGGHLLLTSAPGQGVELLAELPIV